MEVHHHGHHGGKKTWRSYFWEFMMLFLAVFCSYLAEYQLEHKIERERGKQFVLSFYQDLVSDTSKFSVIIHDLELKEEALSTMLNCYDVLSTAPDSTACLEVLYRNSNSFMDFTYSDRTIQQLKNAGGLRLLGAQDADNILEHDNMIREYMKVESSALQEVQTAIRSSFYPIVDFRRMNAPDGGRSMPAIHVEDKAAVNRLFNQLLIYRDIISGQLRSLRRIKNESVVLIHYFKRKYDHP